MKRCLATVLLLGLSTLIAAAVAQPPMIDALTAAGCRSAAAEPRTISGPDTLSIAAHDCLNADGSPLTAGLAVDRMAATAWSTPTQPFDRVDIAIYRTAEAPTITRPVTRSYTQAEMIHRYGPRRPELDVPDYRTAIINTAMIIALPMTVLAPLWIAILLGVHMARAEVIVLRIR